MFNLIFQVNIKKEIYACLSKQVTEFSLKITEVGETNSAKLKVINEMHTKNYEHLSERTNLMYNIHLLIKKVMST